MPAYNIDPEFADGVETGKTCCIIRPRNPPTKVGDTLQLFTGMGTNNHRLLREVTCTAVQPITIAGRFNVKSGTRMVSDMGVLVLLVAAGFDGADEFFEHFEREYGLPTHDLELIIW